MIKCSLKVARASCHITIAKLHVYKTFFSVACSSLYCLKITNSLSLSLLSSWPLHTQICAFASWLLQVCQLAHWRRYRTSASRDFAANIVFTSMSCLCEKFKKTCTFILVHSVLYILLVYRQRKCVGTSGGAFVSEGWNELWSCLPLVLGRRALRCK